MEAKKVLADIGAQRARHTILNINDDAAMRYVVTRQLVAAGYNVIEAETGQEGLQKAASMPSGILLDVQLPDIHGFAVCQMLKSTPQTAGIPVLMISATFVGEEDRERGVASGAQGYLFHPVNAPTLIDAVDKLVGL